MRDDAGNGPRMHGSVSSDAVRSAEEDGAAAPTRSAGTEYQPKPESDGTRRTAYDVAAALRAQAGRAAQATREAAHRVQSVVVPPRSDVEQMSEMPTTSPDEQHTGVMARPATVGTPTRAERVVTPGMVPRGRTGRVRKARLRVTRVDPWSVLKVAFMFSIAIGIMFVVAVFILWTVLDAAGVFTAVGDVVRDVTSSESSGGVQIQSYLGLSRVLGFASLIAVFDVVLVTALATLGAFLYNLAASLLGGFELTLAEDD